MDILYSSLLICYQPQIRESAKKYVIFTERHLQAVWFEQKYFKGLTTSDGTPIKILSPGLWNTEAGPDFLKAHLQIGDQELRGDIELHLSEEGWTQHQHQHDPNYNAVILHLSLWKPKNERSLVTASGTSLIRAYLEPFLTIPLLRITNLIDLDLYPYQCHTGCGKCSQALFRKLPLQKIESFFRKAAEWRLTQKLNRLRVTSKNCFEVGIAMALGYKNNTQAFLDLYHFLSPKRHLGEEELFSLALGACGFFYSRFRKKWEDSLKYKELLSKELTPQKFKLKLNNIRPFNHPIRRIVYLVKMIRDSSIEAVQHHMCKHWTQHWPNIQSWSMFRHSLEDLLPKYDDPYWNTHFTFSSKPSKQHLPLLGEWLKREILVNVFLPILFEKVAQRGDPHEMDVFHKFFASIPAGLTSKSQYLKQRYFGEITKGKVMKMANIEQGAYQLHHDFCIHYEASCEGCTFVNRYKKKFLF